MTKKTIEIFRAGTHVGMDGRSYTFTDQDVAAIAAAYDPTAFSAPAVVGHPKHDHPAYGWATELRVRDDGVLVADLDQVNPAFADIVTAGSFKKISPAFYGPDQANNPKPGGYYLRHIGFLGAAAPGVQGLAPAAFAEGDDEFIAFATDEELRPIAWLARNVGRIFGSLREHIIEKEGREAADRIIPSWDADTPAEIAGHLEAALSTPGPRFSEPTPEPAPTGEDAPEPAPELADPLAAREAALAEREAAVARQEQERAAAFAEGQRQTRAAEDAAWADGLIEAGRLPPGYRPQVVAFCDLLGSAEAIAFAEGEAPQDPRAAFRTLMNGLGAVIRFDEIAGGDGLRFAEGRSVDDLTTAINAEMAAAEAAGRPISAAEASRRVRTTH